MHNISNRVDSSIQLARFGAAASKQHESLIQERRSERKSESHRLDSLKKALQAKMQIEAFRLQTVRAA